MPFFKKKRLRLCKTTMTIKTTKWHEKVKENFFHSFIYFTFFTFFIIKFWFIKLIPTFTFSIQHCIQMGFLCRNRDRVKEYAATIQKEQNYCICMPELIIFIRLLTFKCIIVAAETLCPAACKPFQYFYLLLLHIFSLINSL